MLRKMKEKERVTIVTRFRNEITRKVCLIMEIVSGISEIRTSRLPEMTWEVWDGYA